jgi:hypothetical protein
MSQTVVRSTQEKYRIPRTLNLQHDMPLRLIDGDDPPRPANGARMRLAIERELHGAFVRATGTAQGRLTDSLYDVRRGRQHPCRKTLTRLEELRELKAKKEAAKAIVQVLDRYVEWLWNDETRRVA